jgi:hypothetical protein
MAGARLLDGALSSIEQTASNYLHVLDLLAVDQIYNSCIIIQKY